MSAVYTLIQFLVRLAVGIALAALLALLLTLVREDTTFVESLTASAYVVGCLALLLAVAGHSPGARVGTIRSLARELLPAARSEDE